MTLRLPAVLLLPLGLGASAAGAPAGEAPPLSLVTSIPMPGVHGRIDHLAVDPEGKTLVVAALENGSVEVLDLAAGNVVHRITGLEEPQGILLLPDSRKIVVACGGDGTVRFYDGKSYEALGSVHVGDDADNMRYDPAFGRPFVAFGGGAIGWLEKGAKAGEIPVRGHPEAFQLEAKGTRIFVNVPPSRHVAVLDRATGKPVTTWPITEAEANYPMCLDEARRRLYVGCRKPALLVVKNTETGRTVVTAACSGDVDDIFLDDPVKRLYVSCGEGFLDVFDVKDPDHCVRTAKVPTRKGARTCLLDCPHERLYLAVPKSGSETAEIRVYKTRP